jgi:hypothetical protein
MPSLRVGRLRGTWWGRGATIAVALLALATGLCLFDQEGDGAADHVTPPDLCLGMLAVSFALISLAPLLAAGWTVDHPGATPYAVALHIPDPPPRPPRSFSP